jgi:hypothetical protein
MFHGDMPADEHKIAILGSAGYHRDSADLGSVTDKASPGEGEKTPSRNPRRDRQIPDSATMSAGSHYLYGAAYKE